MAIKIILTLTAVVILAIVLNYFLWTKEDIESAHPVKKEGNHLKNTIKNIFTMLLRWGIFALLMSFMWYLVLRGFLIEKAVRIINLGQRLGENARNKQTTVIAIDFTGFEPRDYMTVICFAFFSFYVVDVWRMWMHLFFQPAIIVRLAPRELHDSSSDEEN